MFSDILSKIYTFSFEKMHLKMLSAKWMAFCLGLNLLNSMIIDLWLWIYQNWAGFIPIWWTVSAQSWPCSGLFWHVYIVVTMNNIVSSFLFPISPAACFTNNFSLTFRMWWKFHFLIIHFLVIRSQQIFAQTLCCRVMCKICSDQMIRIRIRT